MKIHEILIKSEVEPVDEGLMDMVRAGGRVLGGIASLPGAALGTIAGAGKAFAKGYRGAKATVGLDPLGQRTTNWEVSRPDYSTDTPPGSPPVSPPAVPPTSFDINTEFMKLNIDDIKALLNYYKRAKAIANLGIVAEVTAKKKATTGTPVTSTKTKTPSIPGPAATTADVTPPKVVGPGKKVPTKATGVTKTTTPTAVQTTTQNAGGGQAQNLNVNVTTTGGGRSGGGKRPTKPGTTPGTTPGATPGTKPGTTPGVTPGNQGQMSPQAIALADAFLKLNKKQIIKMLDKYKMLHGIDTLNVTAESRK